jgi:hypothetical protein
MKPYKKLIVYRWKSDNIKETYIFNNDNTNVNDKDAKIINDITIYDEDTIENAINKIGLSIQNIEKKELFPIYAWSNKESLLFNIKKIKWSGYDINPYKSNNRRSKELDEPISYDGNYSKLLYQYNLNKLNISFANDNIELKNNKYYYIDNKIPTLETYKKREKKLDVLKEIDVKNTNIISEIYHRIDFQYNLKNIQPLSIIFDNLHTNNIITFIQWVNDNSKVLYKLNKKHILSKDVLSNWTNIEKISKIQCIYLYSILGFGTYCKIIIDYTGLITLSYIIDIRQNVNWKQIIKNKDNIKKQLEITIKQPIKFKEVSLKLNVLYEMYYSKIEVLLKKLSEAIDIFHVNKVIKEKDKNKIICIYKRSSNFNKEIDIGEHIRSKLNLGFTKNEIILELINLGINSDEADKLVEYEIDMIKKNIDIKDNNKVKQNISNTGTIVIIENDRNGYLVNIINIPNQKELSNLLYWISRIISSTRDIKVIANQKTIQQNQVPVPVPIPVQIKPKSNSIKSASSEEDDLGAGTFDLDFGGGLNGGALGKDKHSYFINLLRIADKDLFEENYARDKCQATKQPIVMTPEHVEELKKNNNLHFDNMVEYGSKANIKNVYACPKLWCPQSKIPLDIKDGNAKCPLPNEEAIKMLWDENDKEAPRYVKLIKPNEKGICVPCCFKKPPKKEDIDKCKANVYEKIDNKDIKQDDKKNKKKNIKVDDIDDKKSDKDIQSSNKSVKSVSIQDNKDENYLIKNSAPIQVGRYGIVPISLHKLLYPKVSFALCSKTLNKGVKCLVRKGIQHRVSKHKQNSIIKNDSLLHSLAYLLNFKDKMDFMKDIRNKLDIITFMSLENGEVCKSFMDYNAVIIDKNKSLCNQLNKYINDNVKIKNLLNINDINCNIDNYKLSRLLNIYKAYIKFLDYLSSNDYPIEKTSYYLYSLLSNIYNVLLVIWENEKNGEDVNIVCPYYETFQDIITGLGLNPNVIMLLKDGRYYEPLELKLRSEEGDKMIKLNHYPDISNVINECNNLKQKLNNNEIVYQNLYTLYQWLKTDILKKPDNYIIDRVLINDDLTIDRFLTKSNILLIIDRISISYLPVLIKILNIKKIIFYDDIINKEFKINILVKDLDKFSNKCKLLNINFNLGKIINTNIKEEYYTSLVINEDKINNNVIINTRIQDDLYNYNNKEINRSKKWYQLQIMIANTIIKKYDNNKLKELSKLSIKERINKLIKNFDIKKEINKIRIILEEIPLYSIEKIKEWINNIILYNKYDFYDNKITEDKNEFIFSQNAIIDEIPNTIVLYHKSRPNIITEIENNIEYNNYEIKNQQNNIPDKLPSIFTGKEEKLNSKWIQHKKSKWSNMIYIKHESYNKYTIKEFYEWFSKILNMNTPYDEVVKLANILLKNTIDDNELMLLMLEDPSFFNEYKKVTKQYKTVQIFLDTYYNNASKEERKKKLTEIINKNELYPNDLYLICITKLLNISILVIHRGKYGKSNKDVERGGIDDLKISSSLYVAPNNMKKRPLLIFNKLLDKTKSIYNIVLEKNEKDNKYSNSIYMQYENVPENVKILVEAHLRS